MNFIEFKYELIMKVKSIRTSELITNDNLPSISSISINLLHNYNDRLRNAKIHKSPRIYKKQLDKVWLLSTAIHVDLSAIKKFNLLKNV